MSTTHQCHSQSTSENDNISTHPDKIAPENCEAPENRELAITNRRIHIDKLDKDIGRLNRSLNATSYQLLVMIREFDERGGWFRWSFADGVSWLMWRCDLSAGAARDKLPIADACSRVENTAVDVTSVCSRQAFLLQGSCDDSYCYPGE